MVVVVITPQFPMEIFMTHKIYDLILMLFLWPLWILRMIYREIKEKLRSKPLQIYHGACSQTFIVDKKEKLKKEIKKSLKIEKADYKTLFLTLFLPFLTFIILDITTTYCGVCVLGGVELNPLGITIASRFGFLSLIPLTVGIYACGIAYLTYLFKVLAKNEIWKSFLIVFWCLSLISYSQTVVYNITDLIQTTTELPVVKQEKIISIPQEELKELYGEFEPIRPDFCRLIG